jgi:hypothetical protein
MTDWRRRARQDAIAEGIDPNIFERQINQESGFRTNVSSRAGARGIAQIMPETAAGWHVNPDDPNAALRAAARHMAQYHKQYGNYKDALVAYNAGPGVVGHSLPRETQDYIKIIMGGHGEPQATAASNVPSTQLPNTTDSGVAQQPNQPNLFQLFAQQGQANPSDDPLQATLQRGWALLGELQARKQAAGGSTGSMISSMSSGEPTPSLPPTGSSGKVILSKGADRPGVHTNKAVLNFVGQIAGAYGHPLTIGTGTNHDQMTVNGNVSDHWSGNAADIPATGNTLVKLGQDALIQAGMNPSQARKQTGGLYNVNGYQVIFNTHEGGDHTNHLHVGLGRRHK